MRILFRRTGGFAGRKIEGILETDEMPEADARRLQDLLRRSGFYELAAAPGRAAAHADGFLYRITVENEPGSHRLEIGEGSISPLLRSLLDLITRSILK